MEIGWTSHWVLETSAEDHRIISSSFCLHSTFLYRRRKRNLTSLQVAFHPLLYGRARNNSNTISHPTTALLFITIFIFLFNKKIFSLFFYCHPFYYLLTTQNDLVQKCHYCYGCSILLHNFPTSFPGQAGGIGTFKTRLTGESPRCRVLHVQRKPKAVQGILLILLTVKWAYGFLDA